MAPSAERELVLATCNMAAGYGDMIVVNDLSLEVHTGQVMCLLGPNGCGKSTVVKTMARLLPVISGDMIFSGRSAKHMSTESLSRNGLGYVPQTGEVFPSLTVLENLLTVGFAKRDIDEVLSLFGSLRGKLKIRAGHLSGGERRMLGIARAMMSKELRLLLLDEPTSNLAPQAVESVVDLIAGLKKLDLAIVLVEQNVDVALEVGDQACVIVAGTSFWSGPCSALNSREQLFAMFLGNT